MDLMTVAVSLLLGGVAGGAVNAIYRLVIDRHLDAHRAKLTGDNAEALERTKDALQRERDVILAKNKAEIDETVQARLLERKGTIDREVQEHIEEIRRKVAHDLKTHESALRVVVESELRLHSIDLDLYQRLRRDLVRASSRTWAAVIECRIVERDTASALVRAAREALEDAGSAGGLVPKKCRDALVTFFGVAAGALAQANHAIGDRTGNGFDQQKILEQVRDSRNAANEALDSWGDELRSRHQRNIRAISSAEPSSPPDKVPE